MAAIPKELNRLIAGAGGTSPPRGPTPSSAGAPGNVAPVPGAMSTPQPKEGLAQQGITHVSMVLRLLEQSLPLFGSTTDEGRAVVSALKTLTAVFGKERQKGEELIPAELMQLMASGMPGAAGAPGGAKAIQGAPPTAPVIPPQQGA